MIDVFKVGVHIGMTSNSNAVLGVLLRDLGKVDGAVSALKTNLTSMKILAVGAMAALGGAAVLKGMWDMVKAGSDLNKELERTKQLGGEFARTIDTTRRAAFSNSYQVPTMAPSELVRLQRELATQLPTQEAANTILPLAGKAGWNVQSFTGEDQEEVLKNLVKVVDIRGQAKAMGPDGKEYIDFAKFASELEAANKALVLAGGYLKSNELLRYAQQGGAAIKGQTPEAFYAAGIEAAIALGASKTGTAETSLFAQFIGGTMTKKVAEEMQRGGMLKAGEWSSGRSGGVVLKPEATQRFSAIATDPIGWLTGAGAEQIKALAVQNGITALEEVFRLFGRQTTQRLASEALSNEPQFERARKTFGNIPGIAQQYQEKQDNDLATNIESLDKAWKGFMQALSEQGIPLAINVLQNLTGALHNMTQWAVDNPGTVHTLMEMSGAVAGIAAVLGTATVLAMIGPAGTFALVGGGIIALAGALSVLADKVSWIKGMFGAGTATPIDPNAPHPKGPWWFPLPLPSGYDRGEGGNYSTMGGAAGRQLLKMQQDRAASGNPVVDVHVTNAGDVGSAMRNSISRSLNGPQSGPTSSSTRVTPWGSDLMPAVP